MQGNFVAFFDLERVGIARIHRQVRLGRQFGNGGSQYAQLF
jgi:hypothetical protein